MIHIVWTNCYKYSIGFSHNITISTQVDNDRVFESVFLSDPSISNERGFNVPKTTSVDYCILIINTLVLIENQKVQNIQNIFQQYMFPGVNV